MTTSPVMGCFLELQEDDPTRSVAANLMTFYRLEDFRSLLSREVHVKIEQEILEAP